uniref:rRNA adenine N6-methyltransferase n=1 Tax=Rhizophora mucronata TaxID=61149 RepID=A0A2P2KEZ7_RHIMU
MLTAVVKMLVVATSMPICYIVHVKFKQSAFISVEFRDCVGLTGLCPKKKRMVPGERRCSWKKKEKQKTRCIFSNLSFCFPEGVNSFFLLE